MKWTPLLLSSLTVALIAGCEGQRRNNDTGTAGGAGTESGTMQGAPSATTDTGAAAVTGSDTARAGARMQTDTTSSAGQSNPNQTKSGVTNTETGKSTLGKDVTKTRPDQGQPVTSKGDTIRSGGDSVGH